MTRVYLDASALVMLFYTRQDPEGVVRQLFQLANIGRLEIYISYWAANETLAAIDRLWRRGDITKEERQIIISTVISRAKSWSEGKDLQSNIICVFVNNQLLTQSREFIVRDHISADDALHVCTGYLKDCEFFVFRDEKLRKQFKEKIYDMELIYIEDKEDVKKFFDSLDSN